MGEQRLADRHPNVGRTLTLPEVFEGLRGAGMDDVSAFHLVGRMVAGHIIEWVGMAEDGQPVYVPRHAVLLMRDTP